MLYKERTPKIIWLTGNSGSGKTHAAQTLFWNFVSQKIFPVCLDGDMVRDIWPIKLGFTKADRVANNMAVANLAFQLFHQGHIVIVSTICPYRELRDKIRESIGKDNIEFIFIAGGKESSEEYPYEGRQEGEGK